MGVYEWFLLTNENATALVTVKNENDAIFLAYLVLSLLNKESRYLAAFFVSTLLFSLNIFDFLLEYQLYLITFILYSYTVISERRLKTAIGCVIMLYILIIFTLDAYFYGVGGINGESQTMVYNNIGYIAVFSHTVIICTLVDHRRIWKGLRYITNIVSSIKDSMYRFSYLY